MVAELGRGTLLLRALPEKATSLMPVLRPVLGDQLSVKLASLRGIQNGDVVVMAEMPQETSYVRHHKQKILLTFAAMRHFAKSLAESGHTVKYYRYDQDPPHDYASMITRARQETGLTSAIATEPGEYRLLAAMQKLDDIDLHILEDDRFITSRSAFAAWAKDRKQLRMEFFYRDLRKQTGLLMDGDQPHGGQWNFDSENRKKLPANLHPPQRPIFDYGADFEDLRQFVDTTFADHFGSTAHFFWPITAEQAQQALDFFLDHCLNNFGTYQDAMALGEVTLFHSLISTALNMGLLDPLAVCQAAEAHLQRGAAPINAVEGFIRQILGWREFIRGIYWLKMPDYEALNALDHEAPLPSFYYSGKTDMACLREAITATRDYAYAHHIQRLMITGNFALLAGLSPTAVNQWYLEVYADAYQWVELPNTHGMALFADGGIVGSKPYAASGAYINRMSNYCADCKYNVKDKLGEAACPFNYLYWDFIMRHETQLAGNPRMALVYKNLNKMPHNQKSEIARQAEYFLSSLDRIGPRP